MANNLFISYDLKAPEKNYPKVTAAIQAIGTCVKINLSVYYMSTNLSESDVATRVLDAMDNDDRLVVIKASNAMFFNLIGNSEEFVQEHWNV